MTFVPVPDAEGAGPFTFVISEPAQPLLGAMAYITVCWGFLYFLYRQRIFLKV